jgi:peptidyl-prolyl cis-trans isomerase D
MRPLAEVTPDIKKAIATERAKSQILAVYDKIEDLRSEGRSLAEAAATLKLAARTVEVDRSGRDPAGQPVADLPDAQRLLASAFSSEVGFDADPLQVQGGYIWFDVAGITPSRERSLEEVKDKVEANWREDEIAKRLKEKAQAFMDKLKGGSGFADTARSEGLKAETVTGVKRNVASPPFSANASDKLFATPKDAVASAEGGQPGEQIVFRVTDIVLPQTDMNSDQAKAMAQELNRSLSADLFSQYVAKVQNEIGVTVNRNAVNQVVSGGNANNPFNDDSDTNF